MSDDERARERPWMADDLAELRKLATHDVILSRMFAMMERGASPRAAMIEGLRTLSIAALASFRAAVEREERSLPSMVLRVDSEALAAVRAKERDAFMRRAEPWQSGPGDRCVWHVVLTDDEARPLTEARIAEKAAILGRNK